MTRALASLAILIALALPSSASAQTVEPSLGDIARSDREARQSKPHSSAARTIDEDNAKSSQGPRIYHEFWGTIPAAKMRVVLPPQVPSPRWNNLTEIELPAGQHNAFLLFGDTISASDFQTAANQYVTQLLTRSRFSGSKLTLRSVEDTTFDGHRALLIRFRFSHSMVPHAGMALFIIVPDQVLSAGCMYLEVDEEQTAPMCEDVINSASVEVPTGKYVRVTKPTR